MFLSGRPLGVGTRWSCSEDTAYLESTVLTIGWILPVDSSLGGLLWLVQGGGDGACGDVLCMCIDGMNDVC